MLADPVTELWVLHPRRTHDSAPPRSSAIAALATCPAMDPRRSGARRGSATTLSWNRDSRFAYASTLTSFYSFVVTHQ